MPTVATVATDPEEWPRDGAGKVLPGRFLRMRVPMPRDSKTAAGPAARSSSGDGPITVEVEGTVPPGAGAWEITLHLTLRRPKAG
jgi:hypothetical protein